MNCAKIFAAMIFPLMFCGKIFSAPEISGNGLSEEQRFTIALEVLGRLPADDLEQNPRFKTAARKILERARGTPRFVSLVKQLRLTNQNEGLLEVAAKFPDSESGVEAMRMILADGDLALVEKSLRGADGAKVAEVLGNTAAKESSPLLLPLVTDPTLDLALRQEAARSLARTANGAEALLQLAKEEKLPPALLLTVSAELKNARWEKIKIEAAQIFPSPSDREAKSLPALAELLRAKGSGANGEKIFFRAETACVNCHKIGNRGTEIGPALTEIGDKLGREALFESILEPSAGISFGYEAHEVELKSGVETYGLIVSETAEELVMKDLKGIVTRYGKQEIARRRPLKTSLMPAGLAQTMTPPELVDLVEFLSTLRKAK